MKTRKKIQPTKKSEWVKFGFVPINARFCADGEQYQKLTLGSALHLDTGGAHPFKYDEQVIIEEQQ